MGYSQFLSSLFEDGRVTLPVPAPLDDADLAAGDEVLVAYECDARLEMPGVPPPLSLAAARWGATRFFRACQFAVFRDVDEALLNQELSGAYPEPVSPAVHYSVDLTLRYLPDLTKIARGASEQDPLLNHLERWGSEWPLCSVGMTGVSDVDISGFAADASLMQLYVDRIIAASDKSRLSDARVREAMECSVGIYPHLAKAISSALAEHRAQDVTI